MNILENRRKSSFATHREVCAAAWRALQALYLWKSPRKTSFRVRVTAWSFANVINFIFIIRNKLKVFSPNVLMFSTGLICLFWFGLGTSASCCFCCSCFLLLLLLLLLFLFWYMLKFSCLHFKRRIFCQSWTKYLRWTLDFMWNSVLRETFKFYFSRIFC